MGYVQYIGTSSPHAVAVSASGTSSTIEAVTGEVQHLDDPLSTAVLAAEPALWVSVPGVPSSGAYPVTGAYMIVPGQGPVLANGTFAVYLPNGTTSAQTLSTVKNTGTGTVTLTPAFGGQTVDGASTLTLSAGQSATVCADGTANWRLVSSSAGTPASVVTVSSSPALIASGVQLHNPHGLRRWRAALGDALYSRVPIVCVGDSIVFGQGSDGNDAANNIPDNTQGWVGQLRQLFAKSVYTGAVDAGEGYLFNTDSRVTFTGAQTGANAYSGPLRHSTRLLSGQTYSINAPAAGVLTVIQANNSGDVTGTYTQNAGGSVGLTALTGTGTSITTDITVAQNDAIVISGPASAQTYITGLVMKTSAGTGVATHRVGINGYVTGDALGGQTSGTLNLTSGQQTSAIRKLYDWAGGPGLLILHFGVNDQQFQAGGGSASQNGVTLANYTAWTQQIVNQAVTDGWCVLLLGENPNPFAANVVGGQESDYRNAYVSIAQSTDHVAALNVIDLWKTATIANAAGLMLNSSVHPSRKGHGDIARLLYRTLALPFGENAASGV